MESPRYFTLPVSDSATRPALYSGYLESGGSRYRVVPTEVLRQNGETTSVVFLPVNSSDGVSVFRKYFASLRAISLTATALPGLAILLVGLAQGMSWNVMYFFLALMGAVFLQVAVNLQNDVQDHLKLIDLPGGPGGSGVIQRGWLTASEINRIAVLAFIVGGLAGLPVVIKWPSILWSVALVGGLGAIGYSGWPLRLKYRALGDINVYLLCGPLLAAGFSVAAFGILIPGWIAVGSFFGFMACGLLHVNNMQDINYDSKRGAVTLAVVLGYKRSRWALLTIYTFAYLSVTWGLLTGEVFAGVACVFLGLPITVSLIKKTWTASGPDSPKLNGLRVVAAQLHLVSGVLFVFGYLACTIIA